MTDSDRFTLAANYFSSDNTTAEQSNHSTNPAPAPRGGLGSQSSNVSVCLPPPTGSQPATTTAAEAAPAKAPPGGGMLDGLGIGGGPKK